MLCPSMSIADALVVSVGSGEGRCCRCLSSEEEMKRVRTVETTPQMKLVEMRET